MKEYKHTNTHTHTHRPVNNESKEHPITEYSKKLQELQFESFGIARLRFNVSVT